MDKRQENQMTMFYATQRTLTLNESVWTAKPAVADAAQELDTNIGAVEGCIERQVIDIRGFAKVKEECETAMLNQTILVAGGVRAYATVIGDSVLLGKMDVSRGSLLRHRDSVIAQHCQGIHTAAAEVVANLADYSILPATLTALQTAIDKYVAAIVAPQNAIALRKGATAELRTLLRDTNKLLTKRLDALMEQFAFSNSDFYRDYQNARIVIDLGTGSGEATQTPVPVAA